MLSPLSFESPKGIKDYAFYVLPDTATFFNENK